MVSVLYLFIYLLHLLITFPPSVDAALPKRRSTPLAECQQSKDVSSSSTSSPWDSPETPFQVLKPTLSRAQSAPLTQPSEPVSSPAAGSPPKSGEGVSSFAWSQNQWIAFGDPVAPSCRHGLSVMELQRGRAGAGRSSRFLSDDGAEAYHREDGSLSSSDVFFDRAAAAAPSDKMHNGNKNNGFRDVLYPEFGVKLFFLCLFFMQMYVLILLVLIL